MTRPRLVLEPWFAVLPVLFVVGMLYGSRGSLAQGTPAPAPAPTILKWWPATATEAEALTGLTNEERAIQTRYAAVIADSKKVSDRFRAVFLDAAASRGVGPTEIFRLDPTDPAHLRFVVLDGVAPSTTANPSAQFLVPGTEGRPQPRVATPPRLPSPTPAPVVRSTVSPTSPPPK